MKRWALLCGAMLLFSGIAGAQENPRLEAFGGYSYVRFNPGKGASGVNFNGGSGSVSFNLNSWLGVVGDFGGYHATVGGTGVTVISYLFGPKVAMRRGRITPFAQALFGGARASTSGIPSQNAFATALGGGVDWNATEHLGVRVVQAEYVMTRFGFGGSSYTQNNARISAGVVFRF